MHNLYTNYLKIVDIAKSFFQGQTDKRGNFYRYRNAPKLADIEVISLSITAESLSIDSENLLFQKLNAEYRHLFPNLPDRSNFNRRRRRLQAYFAQLSTHIANYIPNPSGNFLLDSIPLPICQNGRRNRTRICQDDTQILPSNGYLAAHKHYYFGFKLQLLVHQNGVPHALGLCSAADHDSTYLPYLTNDHIADCEVLADKGYLSAGHQQTLFQLAKIRLITPLRKNMKQARNLWTASRKYHRKRIETLFSQLCDQFMLKRNYAKTTDGLFTRINTKIAAVATLQLLNHHALRPINLLKSALQT